MATLHEHRDGRGYYIVNTQFTKGGVKHFTYQVGSKGLRRLDTAGIRNEGDAISNNLFTLLRDVHKEIYTKETLAKFLNAAEAGQTNQVDRLINTKISEVDAKGKDGRTAISLAAERGHKATVDLLLLRGADKKVEDDYGHDAKWWAEFNVQREIVKLLSDKEPYAEEKHNNGGCSAFLKP